MPCLVLLGTASTSDKSMNLQISSVDQRGFLVEQKNPKTIRIDVNFALVHCGKNGAEIKDQAIYISTWALGSKPK